MSKRIFSFLAVFLVVFSVGLFAFSQSTQAVEKTKEMAVKDTYNSSASSLERNLAKKVKADISEKANLNQLGTSVLGNVLSTTLIYTTGVPQSTLSTMTPAEQQAYREIYGNSAIGDLGNYISFLYQPPASTQTYVADVLHHAKIIPQAQAQGLGFAALDPILETWKMFRNVAYFFFVIIFLVIGFMIMFRHKINGQTIVTAQQAIPNIIVALLFVTFSYAIGGFLIDLMYVLMYLLVGLFGGSEELVNQNFIQLGIGLIKEGSFSTWGSVNDAITEMISIAGVAEVFAFASSLTVAVIVAIAILFGVFKLFFELLKSYVNIVANIAFAPILLMIGALPGQNSFGNWFKQLVGNLAAFPAVLLMLLMHNMITNYDLTTGGFMPPYLLGNVPGVAGVLPAVIGIGILLVTPEIVKQVKEALGAKDGFVTQLAQAAGERFKSAMPITTRTLGIGGGAVSGGLGGLGEFARDFRAGGAKWRKLPDYILGRADSSTRGVSQGVRRGVSAAGWLSRSVGANQPDILNPLTNFIDRTAGIADEEKRKELQMQYMENLNQFLNNQNRLVENAGLNPTKKE